VPVPSRRPVASRAADGRAGDVISGGVGLTLATVAANLLGYALTLVAARRLGPAGWGALASLLGLLAIGNVAALAIQATTARRLAAARAERSEAEGLRATAALVAVGTTAIAVALAWPAAAYLRLPSAAGPLWVAAGLLPLVWLGALQGRAQGAERFGLLAVLVVLGTAGRTGAALLATSTGDYVAVAAAGAIGTFVAAAVAGLLVGTQRLDGLVGAQVRPALVETLRTAGAFLGLFVLTSLDLVLARHFLPADQAGHYALGTVLAKAAFWLPQAVSIIAFPLMAHPERRAGATRSALLLVLASGLLVTTCTAALGRQSVVVAGGSRYTDMSDLAWVFALVGSGYAVTQLLLLARIARAGRWSALPLWVAAAVEAVLVSSALHGSSAQIVGAAAAVSVTLAVCYVVAEAAAGTLSGRATPAAVQPVGSDPVLP
jgi:O-antigen/teichoic acid export membrane protein